MAIFARIRDSFFSLFRAPAAALAPESESSTSGVDTRDNGIAAGYGEYRTRSNAIFEQYRQAIRNAEALGESSALKSAWLRQLELVVQTIEASVRGESPDIDIVGELPAQQECSRCIEVQMQAAPVAEELSSTIENSREAQHDLIAAIIELSQSEVSNAGARMGDLYQAAVQQVAELKVVNEQFNESELDRNTFAAIVSRQTRFIEELPVAFDAIEQKLREQMALANEVSSLSNQIGGFADNIRKIGFSAFILSVNAEIVAAQAGGSAGETFGVVARDLKNLFKEVQGANQSIEQMAKLMSNMLPRIGASAETLTKACQNQAAQVVHRVHEFRGGYDRSRSAFLNVLVRNTERSEKIHENFNSILTHLQFQDRMTQMLQKLDEQAGAIVPAVCQSIQVAQGDAATVERAREAINKLGVANEQSRRAIDGNFGASWGMTENQSEVASDAGAAEGELQFF